MLDRNVVYDDDKIYDTMVQYFKHTSFRPLQKEIISEAVSTRRDIFATLRTGFGKSLCYQLPEMVNGKGFTLVISPLLSLIEDQCLYLSSVGIESCQLSSNTNDQDSKKILSNLSDGDIQFRFLMTTPERLGKSKKFLQSLMSAQEYLTRIVIDEVHCYTMWGDHFRTEYKKLSILKKLFSSTPMMCLTATATEKVEQEICSTLLIPDCTVFRQKNIQRDNIVFQVLPKNNVEQQLENFLQQNKYMNECGIVYCFSKQETEKIAAFLNKITSAHAYHSRTENKSTLHKDWKEGKFNVVVATSAFGMGIDHHLVRFVIHISIPNSMTSFVQESGRSGRDDKLAHSVIFYDPSDVLKQAKLLSHNNNFSENAQQELWSIVRYCQNQTQCRKQFLGIHFSTDGTRCENHFCDVCKPNDLFQYTRYDTAPYYQDFLKIVVFLKGQFEISFHQLVDLWKTGKMKRKKIPNWNVDLFSESKPFLISLLLHWISHGVISTDRIFKDSISIAINLLEIDPHPKLIPMYFIKSNDCETKKRKLSQDKTKKRVRNKIEL